MNLADRLAEARQEFVEPGDQDILSGLQERLGELEVAGDFIDHPYAQQMRAWLQREIENMSHVLANDRSKPEPERQYLHGLKDAFAAVLGRFSVNAKASMAELEEALDELTQQE